MDQAARTPPVLPIAAALLAGTGACLALPALPPWPLLALAFATGLGALLHGLAWRRYAGMALLGFGLAGLHAAAALAGQLPDALSGADVVLSGRVVELPRHDARRTQFRFRVDSDASQPAALRGHLLKLSWFDERDPRHGQPRHAVEAGSRWRLAVRLRAPRGLRNPGGFDQEKQALADRLAATGYVRNPHSAVMTGPPQGIDAWRAGMSVRMTDVLGPSSRFVRALAVGDTRGLDDGDWDILRGNGLTHLVAISGFHVGLVAGFCALVMAGLWRLLPLLGRRWPRQHAAGCAAVLGAAGYAAVAGFALPTLRTVLMIAVVVAARLARRAHGGFQVLALAAVAMLLADPLAVLSAGFWLSFAGVAWLLWCLPPDGSRRPLRDLVSAQGVATVGLLPLTVFLFGQASLAGPLANLLAVPWWSLVVVPLALVGTALEAAVPGWGQWSWKLAAWAFDGAWPVFAWLQDTGLALWWLAEPPWFALPLALLGALWLLLPRGVPGKTLALLLWLPLLAPDRQLPGHGEVVATVLDVGQGLSVLVRTRGHALLYDMGPAEPDGFDAGERIVVPALRSLGVRRLDAAVISHGDADHAGGWPAVQGSFDPEASYGPEGSPVTGRESCHAGTAWHWDGVEFRFLHPTAHFPYFGNEASCVLRIGTGHGAILLTGDIGQVVEQRLLRQDRDALAAEVVVVAHHGSRGSSSPAFVSATGARHALVSAAAGSRFGHPHPQVVERWQDHGAEVSNTAQAGALEISMGAQGIRIRARRDAKARLWDAVRRKTGGAGLS